MCDFAAKVATRKPAYLKITVPVARMGKPTHHLPKDKRFTGSGGRDEQRRHSSLDNLFDTAGLGVEEGKVQALFDRNFPGEWRLIKAKVFFDHHVDSPFLRGTDWKPTVSTDDGSKVSIEVKLSGRSDNGAGQLVSLELGTGQSGIQR
jgi:hypothetical protein